MELDRGQCFCTHFASRHLAGPREGRQRALAFSRRWMDQSVLLQSSAVRGAPSSFTGTSDSYKSRDGQRLFLNVQPLGPKGRYLHHLPSPTELTYQSPKSANGGTQCTRDDIYQLREFSSGRPLTFS